jgi:4-amino-4-deoxy-L-arabinose transferase-like glycosyltransferase
VTAGAVVRGRGFVWGLAALGAAGLAVRVAYVLLVEPRVLFPSDAAGYHLLAGNLADGHGYVRPFDLLDGRAVATAEFPPLFPGVVSVVAWLGGTGVTAQRLAMSVVGAATVGLVGLLGRRVGGPAAGLAAAGLAAVHPMLVQPDGILMAETLFGALVAASLLLAYGGRVLALGAVVGLAALTRGEGLLLVPLLAVPVAWRAARWRGVGVAVGAVAVVLAPWTARNWVRLDAFVPVSTNAGGLLAGANCDEVYGGRQEGLWLLDCAHRVEGATEAGRAGRQAREALSYAADHAGRVPRVMAVRWLRSWGLFRPGQQVDYATLEGRTPEWEWAGLALDWALVPLAAVGAVATRRAGRVPVWPLLAMGVLATVVVMATYGNLRFRLAAEPALVVLAAAALTRRGGGP